MSLPALLGHLKRTAALNQVAGLISWDQETMMPPSGAPLRAVQSGAMAEVIHARHADPRIADWISAIDLQALSQNDRRNVEEAERAYDRATKIPVQLAKDIAETASQGQAIWAEARAAQDFAMFAPALGRNIALKRDYAACLASDGADPYDTLLDTFEPGMTTAELLPMLEGLRPRLVALREKIAEKSKPDPLAGTFPPTQQLELSRTIAAELGYDFSAGRLDLSAHPFSAGASLDARITTRTDPDNPLDCLFSTIHEIGHALYTQGAPDPFLPAADYCSMGVHESQSCFWENQIGRSHPFAERLLPALTHAFGDIGLDGPDALYAAVNRVETGFIRTEADEVHYNLHILLRFELERELIAGSLDVDDLEEEWNRRFERDFGRKIPNAALGVLQDVHWSMGEFGYFPTYSLGNIYSACLDKAMRQAMPDRDEMVQSGEFAPILGWLREKIHVRGRLLDAPDLIAEAADARPSTAPLLDYLEAKFTALYDL